MILVFQSQWVLEILNIEKNGNTTCQQGGS